MAIFNRNLAKPTAVSVASRWSEYPKQWGAHSLGREFIGTPKGPSSSSKIQVWLVSCVTWGSIVSVDADAICIVFECCWFKRWSYLPSPLLISQQLGTELLGGLLNTSHHLLPSEPSTNGWKNFLSPNQKGRFSTTISPKWKSGGKSNRLKPWTPSSVLLLGWASLSISWERTMRPWTSFEPWQPASASPID